MQYKQPLALLVCSALVGAVGLYAAVRPSPPQAVTTNVSIQLLNPDGSRYSGAATVRLRQSLVLPSGDQQDTSWGPFSVQVANGVGSTSAPMQPVDMAAPVQVEVYPVDSAGTSWHSREFFLDPAQGRRASGTMLATTLQNGDLSLTARRLQLANAPLFGSLELPSDAASAPTVALHCEVRFSSRLQFPLSDDPLAAPWTPNAVVPLFHWGTSDYVNVRAIAGSTIDTGVLELQRGGTLPVQLTRIGEVEVLLQDIVAEAGARVVLFPTSSFTPFVLPVGSSYDEGLAAAFFRLQEEGSRLAGRTAGTATYRAARVPVGSYMVEVWRNTDLIPPSGVMTAPYFVGALAVVAGSTTTIAVP
jgi:hypothetical protein